MADLRWQHEREFLVGLSAAAGWLDALAYLHLGNVVVSLPPANLVFLAIGAERGDWGLVLHAATVLAAFAAADAVGVRSSRRRTVLLESALLTAFALLWVTTGGPGHEAATTFALLLLGGAAMGLQASIAFAFRSLPIRARGTRPVSLLLVLCVAYVVSAVVVVAVPENLAMAFGPLLLVGSAVIEGRARLSVA